MRGQILGIDRSAGTGAISGSTGDRFEFALSEWRSDIPPQIGEEVDFVAADDGAKAVYRIPGVPEPFSWRVFLLHSSGRVSRSQYWLRWTLPYSIVLIILSIASNASRSSWSGQSNPWDATLGLLTLLAVWPSVAISLKRIHDHDRSGWFYLVLLIPVVQLWPLVEIMFLRGTRGPNRFGADPVSLR